jgi:cytochrome c peroxidase
MKKLFALLPTVFVLFFSACKKENPVPEPEDPLALYLNLPDEPYSYSNPDIPPHVAADANLLSADNTPMNNPVTDHGATLGRVLFYDKILSQNKSISCAGCHKQENGFGDPARFSTGLNGGQTPRHSMRLSNARFYSNGRFFWDERAASLEDQVLMPIQDEIEMNLSLDSLVPRLQKQPYYPILFQNAFGDDEITTSRVSKALAQFIRSMTSFSSKYDAGRALVPTPVQPFPNFTQQENNGKDIYFNPNRGGCAGCHGTEGFIAPGPRNNGLDLVSADAGIGGASGIPGQIGQFKTPSLRNIAVGAPYMHDGRFATLSEVIEHYSTGVKNHPNLSPPLRLPNNGVKLLNLNSADKLALEAFLNTLTDQVFTGDPRFSSPFK